MTIFLSLYFNKIQAANKLIANNCLSIENYRPIYNLFGSIGKWIGSKETDLIH
jgi:hypothetical protein